MVRNRSDDFDDGDTTMHTLKILPSVMRQAVSRWIADFAPSMGAALSYYTFFSLAPLLVILIALAGLLLGREAVQGDIFLRLQDTLGDEAAVMVETLIRKASNPKSATLAVITGLATLLVGATTAFAELQSALDRIWRAPPPPKSGWWSFLCRRLFAFGMVLVIGFLLLVSLVVAAVLSAVTKWWSGWPGIVVLVQAINILVSFALVTVLFAMIYKILPRVRIQWRDVWIGSAVTALLFTIGKALIGVYLGHSGIASAYGAAGSVVVVLLWVYYAAQTFLLGAEFTYVYARTHGSHAREPAPSAASYASIGAQPTLEERGDSYG
jgi:membrane protein